MILQAKDLKKSFKGKNVLNGLNFQVNEGEVHAILGKNGAGKSTFIKIALGLISASDGEITVYGEKPGICNSRVGYLSENITIYPYLSARDNLKVAAYSSNNRLTEENITKILKRINLEEVGEKRAKSFSLGMKRRLQLAMSAMVKEVDLLILDEPTNGLDINGLIWFKEYLKELSKSGVSILMASHAISELQESITNYIIINKGIVARQGNWIEEQNNASGFELTVLPNMLNKTKEAIGEPTDKLVVDGDKKIFWQTNKSYKEVCEFLYTRDIFPENISEKKNSLEGIFLDTVKEGEN